MGRTDFGERVLVWANGPPTNTPSGETTSFRLSGLHSIIHVGIGPITFTSTVHAHQVVTANLPLIIYTIDGTRWLSSHFKHLFKIKERQMRVVLLFLIKANRKQEICGGKKFTAEAKCILKNIAVAGSILHRFKLALAFPRISRLSSTHFHAGGCIIATMCRPNPNSQLEFVRMRATGLLSPE